MRVAWRDPNLVTKSVFLSFMVVKASAVIDSLCRASIGEMASIIRMDCSQASSNNLLREAKFSWFMGSGMMTISICISMVLLSVMNLTVRFVTSVMMAHCCPAGRLGWGILGSKMLLSDILKYSPVEVERRLGRSASLAG